MGQIIGAWNINDQLQSKNPSWMPMITGRYYSCPFLVGTGTQAIVASTLYALPICITEPVTGLSLNMEVTTQAAGTNTRLGIYNDNGGVPGSLLLDGGTFSNTGTGGKAVSISQLLAPGWYWLAMVSDGTPTMRALTVSNGLPLLGFTSNTDVTTHGGWTVAFTYGSLPNPFQAGGALMTTNVPRILLGI